MKKKKKKYNVNDNNALSKLNRQFLDIIFKYDQFIVNSYIDNNTCDVYNNGIINYSDFLMLIKDVKCVPFWNSKCDNLTKLLFLPINDNLYAAKIPKIFNYSNWFKTEHKISKCEIKNKILRDPIKKVDLYDTIKCHKIKLFFNSEQKKYFKRLCGMYRYFYNRSIDFINNYNSEKENTYYYIDRKNKNSLKIIDLKNIKNKFSFMTIRKLIKNNYPEWINELNFPSHLLDMSIREASNTYNKCMLIYKKNNRPFKMKYKNRKNKYETINLEKTMINIQTNSLFYNLKNNDTNKYIFRNIKSSCNFDKYTDICDSSLTWNKSLNEYYLNMCFNSKTQNSDLQKVASIDPGLKTFLTIYSDDSVNKIGIGIREKINCICREIDILVSKQYKKINGKFKYSHQKRRNLKKAMHRKIKYLKNLRSELHNKSLKFLCDNYGKILMPPFETQKMVVQKTNSRLARNLMNVGYYEFLTKLKNKCNEKKIELIIRPEYYTSKTCTNCGKIKCNLKNEDVYMCNNCGLKIDRDTNGARNIMLRNM